MRSFRAETVSHFVKAVLDCEGGKASELLAELSDRYPIALTRDLLRAKGMVIFVPLGDRVDGRSGSA